MIDYIWTQIKPWLFPLYSLIGGTGGIVYLFDRYFYSRPRLAIRHFTEDFRVLGTDSGYNRIRFEAENLGEKVTSLYPTVLLTGFSIEEKWMKDQAHLGGRARTARSLKPRQPELFEFHFPQSDKTPAHWYLKKYRFRLSHRAKRNVYLILSASEPVGAFRYWIEVLRNKLFGLDAVALKMKERRARAQNE